MTQAVEEQVKKVTKVDTGPVQAIQNVKRTVPDSDKYQDINVADLPSRKSGTDPVGSVQALVENREAAHQEVVKYEEGPAPIQGVWLNVRGDA